MNPVKAGICRNADEYPHSSAGKYLKEADGITDTALISEIVGEKGIAEFLNPENDDQCLDMNDSANRRVTNEAAEQMIRREPGSLRTPVGKVKERKSLNLSVNRLLKAGSSIRRLS